MASKQAVKIDGECVKVDPQLIFQRSSLIATNGSKDDPASFLEYELCTHPAALFDHSSLSWEANKPALADTQGNWSRMKMKSFLILSIMYLMEFSIASSIMDTGETFESVCKKYVNYVTRKYGKATFDGHDNGPDIKDATPQRQNCGSGPTVTLTFCILGSYLKKTECLTIYARGDADVLIVKTAIQYSKSRNTVLVGDDTDLLVLLLHRPDINGKELYFRSEPK